MVVRWRCPQEGTPRDLSLVCSPTYVTVEERSILYFFRYIWLNSYFRSLMRTEGHVLSNHFSALLAIVSKVATSTKETKIFDRIKIILKGVITKIRQAVLKQHIRSLNPRCGLSNRTSQKQCACCHGSNSYVGGHPIVPTKINPKGSLITTI